MRRPGPTSTIVLAVLLLATTTMVSAAPRGSNDYRRDRYRRELQGNVMSKSAAPSARPSQSPRPTSSPMPSAYPTTSPAPSATPSVSPTERPSASPTAPPTDRPSTSPSVYPTQSPYPTSSPAPTVAGFTTELAANNVTLSAVCESDGSASSSDTFYQIFEFQYYMYTNAGPGKVRTIDERYLDPLAGNFLVCATGRGDYNFTVHELAVTLHNNASDGAVGTCPSAADGTKCVLGVGSFTARLSRPGPSGQRRRHRRLQQQPRQRHLAGEDLSDPDLIIAFGAFLTYLFAGTRLLDADIKELAFNGFINGFSDTGQNPGVNGRLESSANAAKPNVVFPVVTAIVVALAVAAVVALLVLMRRRHRRATAAPRFRNLDAHNNSGAWATDLDPPPREVAAPAQTSAHGSSVSAAAAARDRRALEDSLEPEFDFDVDVVSQLADWPTDVSRPDTDDVGGMDHDQDSEVFSQLEDLSDGSPHYAPPGPDLRYNRGPYTPDTLSL